jgi:hypothetical protein
MNDECGLVRTYDDPKMTALGHIPFSDKPILRGTSLGDHDVFSEIQSDTVYDQQYDVG